MRLKAALISLFIGAPATPPTCKRSDFDSFEAFVDCQVAAGGVSDEAAEPKPAPPPPRPEPDLPPGMGRPRGSELAEMRREQERYEQAFIGTLIPGIGLFTGGGVTMIVGSTLREEVEDTGPVCTVGKRCGNTCIEVADTCHVGTGAAGPLTRTGRHVVLAGGLVLASGVGMLIASLVFRRRSQDLKWAIDRIRF